jgi:uroporphyrinogen-III synthase
LAQMQTMPEPKLAPILLLTRPIEAARRFATQLKAQVETLYSPLMQIDFLTIDPVIAGSCGIILTSENGAAAAGRMSGLPRVAWCVGDRTAVAAAEEGFTPISAGGDADALIALILSHHETGPLLHVRGEHVRGDVAKRLNVAGVVTREVIAYRQQSQPLSPHALAVLSGKRPVILPLFSPRTVTILVESGTFAAPLHVVPIGAAAAELALELRPQSILQAESPDAMAMIKAVRASLRAATGS